MSCDRLSARIFCITLARCTSTVLRAQAQCPRRSPGWKNLPRPAAIHLLARGQSIEPAQQVLPTRARAPPYPTLGQRVVNAIQQQLIVERLFDEIQRALLHGGYRHRHIAVASDDDHGYVDATVAQKLLRAQIVAPWNADIQQQTTRVVRLISGQEGFGIGRNPAPSSHGLQETPKRIAQRRIVVHNVNQRSIPRVHARGNLGFSDGPFVFPLPQE
jgi:hypothetical protein